MQTFSIGLPSSLRSPLTRPALHSATLRSVVNRISSRAAGSHASPTFRLERLVFFFCPKARKPQSLTHCKRSPSAPFVSVGACWNRSGSPRVNPELFIENSCVSAWVPSFTTTATPSSRCWNAEFPQKKKRVQNIWQQLQTCFSRCTLGSSELNWFGFNPSCFSHSVVLVYLFWGLKFKKKQQKKHLN